MRGWVREDFSSSPKSPKFLGLKPCGLHNEGDSCFFNALIQSFYHVHPAFRTAILSFLDDTTYVSDDHLLSNVNLEKQNEEVDFNNEQQQQQHYYHHTNPKFHINNSSGTINRNDFKDSNSIQPDSNYHTLNNKKSQYTKKNSFDDRRRYSSQFNTQELLKKTHENTSLLSSSSSSQTTLCRETLSSSYQSSSQSPNHHIEKNNSKFSFASVSKLLSFTTTTATGSSSTPSSSSITISKKKAQQSSQELNLSSLRHHTQPYNPSSSSINYNMNEQNHLKNQSLLKKEIASKYGTTHNPATVLLPSSPRFHNNNNNNMVLKDSIIRTTVRGQVTTIAEYQPNSSSTILIPSHEHQYQTNSIPLKTKSIPPLQIGSIPIGIQQQLPSASLHKTTATKTQSSFELKIPSVTTLFNSTDKVSPLIMDSIPLGTLRKPLTLPDVPLTGRTTSRAVAHTARSFRPNTNTSFLQHQRQYTPCYSSNQSTTYSPPYQHSNDYATKSYEIQQQQCIVSSIEKQNSFPQYPTQYHNSLLQCPPKKEYVAANIFPYAPRNHTIATTSMTVRQQSQFVQPQQQQFVQQPLRTQMPLATFRHPIPHSTLSHPDTNNNTRNTTLFLKPDTERDNRAPPLTSPTMTTTTPIHAKEEKRFRIHQQHSSQKNQSLINSNNEHAARKKSSIRFWMGGLFGGNNGRNQNYSSDVISSNRYIQSFENNEFAHKKKLITRCNESNSDMHHHYLKKLGSDILPVKENNILGLLAIVFTRMTFSLRPTLSIAPLYEHVMGHDMSQQDVVEVRGKFFDMLCSAVDELKFHTSYAHNLHNVMRGLFAGTLHEMDPDSPHIPRQLDMEFFQLEATLTQDTCLEQQLQGMTETKKNRRISFTPPEIICFNLNRIAFSTLQKLKNDNSMTQNHSNSEQRHTKSFQDHSHIENLHKRDQEPVAIKLQCMCCFPKSLCTETLLPPTSYEAIEIKRLKTQLLTFEEAYQKNIRQVAVLTADDYYNGTGNNDDDDDDKATAIASLIEQQETLRQKKETYHKKLMKARLTMGTLYDLQSVIVHRGNPYVGHYWCYVRCPNSDGLLWYRLDDHDVALASFQYMCVEAVGSSAKKNSTCYTNQRNLTAIYEHFLGDSMVLDTAMMKLAKAYNTWLQQQQYTTQSDYFTSCRLLMEPSSDSPPSAAAYSLFYVRRKSRKKLCNDTTSFYRYTNGLQSPFILLNKLYNANGLGEGYLLKNQQFSSFENRIMSIIKELLLDNQQLLSRLAEQILFGSLQPSDEVDNQYRNPVDSTFFAIKKYIDRTLKEDNDRKMNENQQINNSVVVTKSRISLDQLFEKWETLLPCLPQHFPEPFNKILLLTLSNLINLFTKQFNSQY